MKFLKPFLSLQDTVVALQALAKFASEVYSDSSDLKITVANGGASHTFVVNKTHELVYQSYEVR